MNKKIFLIFALSLMNICLLYGENTTEKLVRNSDSVFRTVGDKLIKLDKKAVTVKLKEGKKLRNDVKAIRSNILGYIDVAVPADVDVEDYVNHLKTTGDYELVKYNEIGVIDVSPNDTEYLYGHQWYLSAIDMQNAWIITTGSPNVKVAVLDNGFDCDHEDLWYGYDSYKNIDPLLGYDYYLNSSILMTERNHGTQVSGIISAKTNNGRGVAGIAGGYGSSGVQILPYCVSAGTESDINLGCVDDAILLAVENGAKVINMSFGTLDTTLSHHSDFIAAIDYAYSQGVTLVASTGNDATSYIQFPACYPKVIAVGNMSQQYKRFYNSDYGIGIDLVAPGVSIYSTKINNDYGSGIGTSFATPQVAGVAALMLSVNPDLTPNEIRTILNNTAYKINSNEYNYNSGWCEEVGHGLLNACAALLAGMNISISGPSTICSNSTNTYTINDPIYASIEWSIDNSYFDYNISGNQCSVTYIGTQQYNVANLTATIRWNGKIIKTLTKRIVMHGTDLIVYGEQGTYVSPNGTFPYRLFTIPANSGSRTISESIDKEVFADKESLPINFIKDNTRDLIHPPVDWCGYGITEINGGNMVYLSSSRFDGMDISFSGTNSPTYFYHNGSYVSFEMPYTSPNYPVTLQAHSDSQCHDFCLTFNVVPLPGVLYGDDVIWVNIDGSMLYISFMYGGEPIGNGQFYFPNYSVTISKIPGGTNVYSNTFPGTQTSFSVNTSTWTSGIYSIRIVQGNNIYTKSICL